MHHCLEEFDKGVLKSRTWHFALKKHVLRDLANYEKQVTFIYINYSFVTDAGQLASSLFPNHNPIKSS